MSISGSFNNIRQNRILFMYSSRPVLSNQGSEDMRVLGISSEPALSKTLNLGLCQLRILSLVISVVSHWRDWDPDGCIRSLYMILGTSLVFFPPPCQIPWWKKMTVPAGHTTRTWPRIFWYLAICDWLIIRRWVPGT